MPAGRRAFGPADLLERDAPIGGFESYYSSMLAFAPDGDLLVLEEDDEISARIQPAGGVLGPAQRLGSRAGGQFVAAGTGGGRWLVARSARRAPGLTVNTATRGRFGAARRFAGGRGATLRVEVVAGPGAATIAWSDRWTTWTAEQGASGRLSAPRPATGRLQAIARRADGELLLVTGDGGAEVLRARVRAAGTAAFGAPEPIAGASEIYDVLAEFAPGSGQAVVSVQRNEFVRGEDSARQALLTATRR